MGRFIRLSGDAFLVDDDQGAAYRFQSLIEDVDRLESDIDAFAHSECAPGRGASIWRLRERRSELLDRALSMMMASPYYDAPRKQVIRLNRMNCQIL